ncbi:MAG: ASCH domain-containing protein [Chloroflexota bacterium]
MTPEIDTFWNAYLLTLPEAERNLTYYEAASWGNSDELADTIATAILSGVKTTTSRLEWEREKSNDPSEKIGDISIVLDGKQRPVCIVEVVDLFIKPFDQVEAAFVYQYGEGSRDMDFWNMNMWDYYVGECAAIGLQASRNMPMICEVFKVIFK